MFFHPSLHFILHWYMLSGLRPRRADWAHERMRLTVSSLHSICLGSNEWNIHQSFYTLTTHIHTNKSHWALRDCDLFADAGQLHPFVCSPSSRTAQYASPQLIKMPAEFPSGRPGCKFLPGSVAWQADTQPLNAQRGKWMKSNEARVIMKLILPQLTFSWGAAPCSCLLWAIGNG